MIAFTTMMWMAEILGYDTAPMEGFFEGKVKSALIIPDHVRVVALLAVGKRKGPDKPYAGRHEMRTVFFSESWGESLKLQITRGDKVMSITVKLGVPPDK